MATTSHRLHGEDIGVRSPTAVANRALAVVERLDDPSADERDLLRLLVEHGESPSLSVTAKDLAELRQVATELAGLFNRQGDVDDWAQQLNAMLAQWASPPHLAHEGIGWHLHVDRGEDASLAEWFMSSSAMALALLLARSGEPPIRRCGASTCNRSFLQSWSGGERRFCSTTCATRTRVSNHRSRRARQPPSIHTDHE